jgi:proteasome lid subunit RPN8/RPN11
MADFKIDCSDALMAKIEAITFSETRIEVGGFLVGSYDAFGAKVTEVLPAKHSVGKSTQLTFTHDTWNALYADLKETGGEVIGWFHSHPNFGVFLSEHDQFIQQNFFKNDGNITIVVDPIRGRRGWFYSNGGKIKKYGAEEDTTRARLGKSSTNPDENIEAVMGTSNSGMTTGKVIAISAITSLLGVFLGFALNTVTSSNDTTSIQISQLEAQITDLYARVGVTPPSVTTSPQVTTPTVSAKPSTKATAKPSTKASTKAPAPGTTKKVETPTATSLNTTVVIPGNPCKKGDVDPSGKYSCSTTKSKGKTSLIWTIKKVNPKPSTPANQSPAASGISPEPSPSTSK